MKKNYTFFLAIFLFTNLAWAQYSTRSFSYDGVTRQYRLYVPASYDGSQAVPFVIALHGLGDNMTGFSNINLKAVADTANFIFAIPQALVDALITGQTAWNSGAGAFGVTLNASVDDVGFLNALMDTVSANYNINQSRIYATGFSMGGFMSNRLACELNNRVAAIASVSGTIGGSLNCQPGRAIPVAHFHGTADATVPYTGNTFGNDPEVLVNYWVSNNGCNTTAIIDSLPDTKNDGKTIIHYKYLNGNYNTEVEFFKVVGGQHEWLTAANDINYSVEIWRFFNRFEWSVQTNIVEEKFDFGSISLFPNPAQNEIQINVKNGTSPVEQITLSDIAGRNLLTLGWNMNSNSFLLNTSSFANGIYMLSLQNGEYKQTRKIVISK